MSLAQSGEGELFEAFCAGLEIPPPLAVSEWSKRHFVLSAEGSAEPGRFNPQRAAYQPGMMDAFNEDGVTEIVLKTSAQVGKTTLFLVILGYVAHRQPGPVLFVEPTLEMAEAFSVERLDPAIRDCPTLAELFPAAKSRAGDNKLLHKRFPGGFVQLAGANSPTSLRMRAIKYAIADEVDAYPVSAGKEGDPIELVRKRQTTFWDAITLLCSTPTHKGASKITRAYDESDKRKFMVPCPHCGHHQELRWKADKDGGKPSNITWKKGDPASAFYICEGAGCLLDDVDLKSAVREGHWEATAPFKGIAGFHISELYSPFSSLPKIVAAFDKAVGFPDRMQTFWNTTLGLEWAGEVIGTPEAKVLFARRESYPGNKVPERAGLLTAAVDVQHDRLELQVMAWGFEDEAWLLSHRRLMGDPSGNAVWANCAELLSERYPHELGQHVLGIEAVALDTGGHHTQKVYDFCVQNILGGRLWWPIKGVSGWGKPIWMRSERTIAHGVRLFLVGVDDAKSLVVGSLAKNEPGPGYLHLPDSLTIENLERLTAEKVRVTLDPKGFPKREWFKPDGAANEEFDCAVYNNAARKSINVDMIARLEALRRPPAPTIDAAALARKFKAG
jgi:phage terminase large subunit GpA-like protein